MNWRKRRPRRTPQQTPLRPTKPTPQELITEAREKLNLATVVLRPDEETPGDLLNMRAEVEALNFRVDVIFDTYEGRK